ncbi:MAG: hypothetical protein QOG38_2198 [Hyphomicrobiales bacterium]|nr:hypothetical protein [Hyphomicrobiales bacterium]
MTDLQFALKLAHILGAAVLFGTGLGIAFFMLMAHRTRRPEIIAHTARIVVLADVVFTATAIIAQPLTVAALVDLVGYAWQESWVIVSLALYVFTGVCWLPVVWIQVRLRRMAEEAASLNAVLPPEYHRLYRIWFVLGWPAFLSVIAIFALMVWKPQFW